MNRKVSEAGNNMYRDPKAALAFLANLFISLLFGTISVVSCDWNDISFKDQESLTPSPIFDINEPQTVAYEVAIITVICILVSIILAYASLIAAERFTRCLLYTGAVMMIVMIILLWVLSGSLVLMI